MASSSRRESWSRESERRGLLVLMERGRVAAGGWVLSSCEVGVVGGRRWQGWQGRAGRDRRASRFGGRPRRRAAREVAQPVTPDSTSVNGTAQAGEHMDGVRSRTPSRCPYPGLALRRYGTGSREACPRCLLSLARAATPRKWPELPARRPGPVSASLPAAGTGGLQATMLGDRDGAGDC